MLERNIFSYLNTDKNFSMTDGGFTVAECAAFSSSIYDGLSPPPGWQLLHSNIDSHTHVDLRTIEGYVGACYTRDLLTKNAKIIFVHRGTVFKFPDVIGNMIGNIETTMGKVPPQIGSVKELIMAVSAKIMKIYGAETEDGINLELLQHIKYMNTGHSLGAILSDCAAVIGMTPSITFENPGSKPIIQNLMSELGVPPQLQSQMFAQMKSTYQVFQGGVNLINTCNEQTGKTFRIKMTKEDYDFEASRGAYFPVPSSYLLNSFYVIGNTVDQHKINKIFDKLNSDDFGCEEIQNPIGLNAGYVEYLDEKHRVYWNNYFEFVWDNSPDIHAKYENDVNKYIIWSYVKLNEIQQQAKPGLMASSPDRMFDNTFVLFNQKQQQEKDDELLNDFVIVESNNEGKKPAAGCSIL